MFVRGRLSRESRTGGRARSESPASFQALIIGDGSPRFGGAGDARGAIAVIGMSCRLPGAPNPDAYWELLRKGRDAIIETPPERRSLYGLADPDESTQGLSTGGTWTASTGSTPASSASPRARPRRWTRSSG